ncbi:hypothetical protein D2U14_03235 [Lacticaseibacillus paracasei]|nr:hypothetical protein D2U14_03235 [Lacticaseibacillus paracasei]
MLDFLTIKVVLQPNTVEGQLIATKRRLIFQWRKSVVFCFLIENLFINFFYASFNSTKQHHRQTLVHCVL